MMFRSSTLATLVAFSAMAPQAQAQGFLDSIFKAATDNVASKAGVPLNLPGGLDAAAQLAAQQQGQQVPAAQAVVITDPGCKKGQLINPYYVMLHANLLPDASLADSACVSSTQLQALNGKYSKLVVK